MSNWATEGPQIDPEAGTILADTGAITLGGLISGTIIITRNVSCVIELVKRNATNNADVKMHPIPCYSDNMFVTALPFSLGVNERIVLRMRDTVTGLVQCSILW